MEPEFEIDERAVCAPLPRHELVLSRCPNPRAISVSIASQRALDWVISCSCYFDSLLSILLPRNTPLPATATAFVHECYDPDEVFKYVANKPFVKS